jgi:uncharacterized membrane protein
MELIDKIGQLLATLCCSIFAGASLYINLVEHPARMECGTELAATEFAPSYRRAAIMQASLAILGFLASMLVWLRGNDGWWLVGGLLLVLVVPFTLIVIMPTNRKLLDPSLDKGADSTAKLLSKWASLHAVRTCLSILALLIFLYILMAK